jgi:hypothetical protein
MSTATQTPLASSIERLQRAYMAGWGQLNPRVLDPNWSNRYARREVLATLALADQSITPESVVHIAESNPDDADLLGTKGSNPIVCEATGRVAAQRIAEGSHRLATPEEIHSFRQAQIKREEACAEMERNNPQNRKNTERIVERTVVMTQAEAERAGYTLTAPPQNQKSTTGDTTSAAAVLQNKAEGRGNQK